ncbi:uncharacterized protein (DUF302 family) [Lewinella aquimaris]|uniref:Uncharacterized protein (DUF302 family) n=1 Tax=Neolewinella aquimaris TaxID=1835722 RepID=A0A840DZJ2_9BACT|nr:DUF302 domain-containing protein [Neolewinella aquimaris]MBB4078330.1 uncharacterized protein (DUF302 family) [Neolewinella aquimaris]
MIIRTLLYAVILITSFGCNDDDLPDLLNRNEPKNVTGLNYVEAEGGDFTELYDKLITTLNGNTAVSIVAQVDHAANAQSVGESLRPTRTVLFGNPRLGTPLMQINPQAGLDLPQKMLVYEAEDDDVILAYNTVEYLANRHGVSAASTLVDMRDDLGALAAGVGNDNVVNAADNDVSLNEGVMDITVSGSVDSVYAKLRAAIVGNANLRIIAELDHQANAASVGLELPAMRLIVFGNPQLGTPLLQEERSVGIDLPQKMLVYALGDDNVTVAYNDPYYLAERHDIDEDTPELATIRDALSALARTAVGL